MTLSRRQRERQAARSRNRRADMGWGGKQLQQVLSVGQMQADTKQPLVERIALALLFILPQAANIWIQSNGGRAFVHLLTPGNRTAA